MQSYTMQREFNGATMDILVTGPESSCTKLVAHLLTRAGANVLHYTPRPSRGDQALDGTAHDHTVLVFRNGMATTLSMVENSHAPNLEVAEEQLLEEILHIVGGLRVPASKVTMVTCESLQKEEAIVALCRRLGLATNFEHDQVQDSNAKYFGGEYFEDRRGLTARGVKETAAEYYGDMAE